jgi:hypothetical protein
LPLPLWHRSMRGLSGTGIFACALTIMHAE